MVEGETVPPREIKEIAERALRLQTLILRRAWGVQYAALSLAMFVTIFASRVVDLEFGLVLAVISGMAASGTAWIAILWAFRRARDTIEIRNVIVEGGGKGPPGYRAVVPALVAIYAVIILSVVFFRPDTTAVILTVYATFAAYLYYALRLSFPLKLPPEAIVALSSFAVATTGSIVLLSFLDRSPAPFGVLWASTIVIWLLAAWYARTRPSPKSTGVLGT